MKRDGKQEEQIRIIITLPDGIRSFVVPVSHEITLLEAIRYIQEKIDPSITIRWNCRSGQCGICALLVNDVPKLACQEKIRIGAEYTIKPICLERQIHGLICDLSDLYKQYFLISRFYWQSELQQKEEFENLLLRLENQRVPHISLDDIEMLGSLLWQITRYPWFEECFRVNTPRCVPLECSQREMLLKYGIIDSAGKTQYRINIIKDCTFVTDGPWDIHYGGVFPFSDESELILKYIEDNKIDKITKGIVDPACGCGHTVIAYWGDGPRFAFDINPRAGYWIAINALINQREVRYRNTDIFKGLPSELDKTLNDKPLFAINMPHALSPYPNLLPKTSDGGETGLKWTIAALKALTLFNDSGGVAVILCYSLGNAKQNRWDIVEQAEKIFPKNKIQWVMLKDVRIWRINGKKEQPNPMPLREGLPKKADCRLYVNDIDREKPKQGYIQLVRIFESKGWDVLGCGILEVRL